MRLESDKEESSGNDTTDVFDMALCQALTPQAYQDESGDVEAEGRHWGAKADGKMAAVAA